MAASAHSDYVDELLKRVYTPDVMEFFYNNNAPLLNKLDDIKLIPTALGDGFYWPFGFHSGQNIGTPAEDANVPTPKAITAPQGRVRLGQFVGNIELSLLLAAAGQGSGAWKSVVKTEMNSNLVDLTKHMNRIFAGTHGTGRIAQVNAATSSSTSFVGKLPVGVTLLRPNMRIAIYDDDTGSGGSEDTDEVISKIVPTTRTVTVGNAQSLDANDHVYIAGSYGAATVPNGLLGLVDDATYLTTLHNVSRSTYEEMKAVVDSNSGVVRDLTEDLLIRNALRVENRTGQVIDTLVMNHGQLEKFVAFMRPDRRITHSSTGDKYAAGYREAKFVLGANVVDVLVDPDITPRTVYGLTIKNLRRVGEKRPRWLQLGGGGEGGVFVQGVDSNGYKTTQTATLICFSNVANVRPDAHFRIDDCSDPLLCGTYVGGTDS